MLSRLTGACTLLIILLKNVDAFQYPWENNFPVSYPVYKSEECLKQAEFIKHILDVRINPCNDFYGFVCNKWQEMYPVPPNYSEWSFDMFMSTKSLDQVIDLLSENPTYQDTLGLKQAKELFKSCMELPYLGIVNLSKIRSYITPLHYFPILNEANQINFRSLPWVEIHNYYISFTGESGLFELYIRANIYDRMKPMLHISQIDSPFGLINSMDVWRVNVLKRYKEFLMALLNQVIPFRSSKVSYTIIEKRLLEVLTFRRKLWKLKNAFFSTSNICNIMTVDKMEKFYNSVTNAPTAYISWTRIMYALYKSVERPLNVKNMQICVNNKEYFPLLAQLLGSSSDKTIVNHLHLYFIERHVQLDSHLKDLLTRVVVHDSKLEGQIRYLPPKEYTCAVSNEKTEAIGKAYVKRYFPLNVKEEGELLAEHMRSMIKLQINGSTWLDDETFEKALRTIDLMKMEIGYPEYYDNPSLKTGLNLSPHVRPALDDVFYTPKKNRLSLSTIYFNPPLYHQSYPPSIKYGAIGTFMAHEMYHAFSTRAISCKQLDICWSNVMFEKYKEKTMCFVEQFDDLQVKELKNIAPRLKTNGQRTVDENVADTMGLSLAFRAFRKEVWKTRKCPVLQNLPSVNCEQLFFISFAMSFCSSIRVDKLMEIVQAGTHSPDGMRVNGAVSNFQEFSRVFDCPKNAPMNPSKRCDLWK